MQSCNGEAHCSMQVCVLIMHTPLELQHCLSHMCSNVVNANDNCKTDLQLHMHAYIYWS